MVQPSLFPMFMNPLGGGGVGGGDGLILELMADPEITLDPDIQVMLEEPSIELTVEDDIEIEVD